MDSNPTSPHTNSSANLFPDLRNFSLVLGGPLYQLFRKAHLEDEDVVSHLTRRILVICGTVWLPLAWFATASDPGGSLTLSGLWFSWVSNPILHFLMLRRIYRIAIRATPSKPPAFPPSKRWPAASRSHA